MEISLIQTRGRTLPPQVPLDFCEDFSVETDHGVFHIENGKEVVFEITTFGVRHWYCSGRISMNLTDGRSICGGAVRDKDGNRVDYPDSVLFEICRNVTKEEIEQDPIRWQGYEEGWQTNAFYRVSDIMSAIEVVKGRFPGYKFRVEK